MDFLHQKAEISVPLFPLCGKFFSLAVRKKEEFLGHLLTQLFSGHTLRPFVSVQTPTVMSRQNIQAVAGVQAQLCGVGDLKWTNIAAGMMVQEGDVTCLTSY